jgi:hypothetical protein
MPDSAPALDDVQQFEVELDALLVSCHADPLRYAVTMWDWGAGELALERGPKPWQAAFLRDLGALIADRAFNGIDPVKPIKMAISSGVGVGKTALIAWIFHFLLDTRPDCKCRVTANTVTQLDTATWAEIRKWGALKLTANRWSMNTEQIYHIGDRVNWFGVKTTCAPENAQAFAGWHNRRSTTANFYDEASTIDDLIFAKGRGIEVDGEPFQFVTGNCSRRQGQLHRAVFGSEQDDWNWRIINGEECDPGPVTKDLYREWADTYGGRDSDYYRVHVLGLPPNADELQYIDHPRVKAAMERDLPTPIGDEPLIAGVDVSGGGSAWTVCRFRRGFDARTVPAIRISGEKSRDRQLIISKLDEALRTLDIKAMFIDAAFGAAVVERLRMLGHKQVIEVNFGGESPDPHDANMRAHMWRKAKEGLLYTAIPLKDQLAGDLEAPGYHLNNKDQLVIESKKDMQKRGVKSPDDGDAHVLTYAQSVRPDGLQRGVGRVGWAPSSVEWAG